MVKKNLPSPVGMPPDGATLVAIPASGSAGGFYDR